MKSKPLEGKWIGLSGAVPIPGEFAEWEWNDLDIRLTVLKVVARLLEAGANVVHGSHPTFVPLIEDVVTGNVGFDEPKRVRMFVGRKFFPSDEKFDEFYRRHDKYAHVEPIFGQDTDKVLSELRDGLIAASEALICVGGRIRGVQQKPGVEEEVRKALEKIGGPLPVYVAGAAGGFARYLYDKHIIQPDQFRQNRLTEQENEYLAQKASPWEATELIREGLTRYFAH
jgi:hypothetical protein